MNRNCFLFGEIGYRDRNVGYANPLAHSNNQALAKGKRYTMKTNTPTIIPTVNDTPFIRQLVLRIEHLEDLASMSGDMMLFIVSYQGHELLVADTDWQSVANKYHMQENIDYIGRASMMYKHPQIIRSW